MDSFEWPSNPHPLSASLEHLITRWTGRFLILDSPKIALTGDINGLLLALSWLLQIFWKSKREQRRQRRKKERKGGKEYGNPPPTLSHRSSPLSLIVCPNLFPQKKLPCRCYCCVPTTKKGALYESNIYFWALNVSEFCGAQQRGEVRLQSFCHKNPVSFPAHLYF